MNSIRFYRDDYDKIIRIEYSKDNTNYNDIIINEEDKKEIFEYLIIKYPDYSEEDLSDKFLDTFINVSDEDMVKFLSLSKDPYEEKFILYDLKEEERKFEEKYPLYMENEKSDKKKDIPKKIERNNILKKQLLLSISSLTLATLLLATIKDKEVEVTTLNDDNNNSLDYQQTDILLDSNSSDNHIKYEDLEFEDNTLEEIPEEVIDEEEMFPEIETDIIIDSETPDEVISEEIDGDIRYIQVSRIEPEWWVYDKYDNTRNDYYEIIKKYSDMFGVDADVMLAIACHESGYHSEVLSPNGAVGLMQIQTNVWESKYGYDGCWLDNGGINVYNFDTSEWEQYHILAHDLIISSDLIDLSHALDVRYLEDNIKAGVIIFKRCLIEQNYDYARAIQAYNYGSNYMQKIDNYTGDKSAWLDYRWIIQNGDNKYLENVLKYLPEDHIITYKDSNGEEKKVMFISNEKNMTR